MACIYCFIDIGNKLFVQYLYINMNVCFHYIQKDAGFEPLIQKAFWHGGSTEGEK